LKESPETLPKRG